MYYSFFDTRFGTACLVSGGRGISAFFLPDTREKLFRRVRKGFPGAVLRKDRDIRKAEALLRRYFSGHKVSFRKVRVDLAGLNKFTVRVLKKTGSIPFGSVKTYAWAGSGSARPAGNALGVNPVPVIIPCHRVIKSDGALGGYSGGRGWKKKLLDMEGWISK